MEENCHNFKKQHFHTNSWVLLASVKETPLGSMIPLEKSLLQVLEGSLALHFLDIWKERYKVAFEKGFF